MSEKTVSADNLRKFLVSLYKKTGMKQSDAEYCAECAVKTELWGIRSHGIMRTPIYIKRLLKLSINPDPQVTTLNTNMGNDQALVLVDGDHGHGYVVARYAMQEAIKRARFLGAATVIVKNSNHFGAASLFTRLASAHEMIGIVATNSFPIMSMLGSKESSVGNNPIAFSAPISADCPFSLDISLSEVSLGKLMIASRNNEKIPLNWAVDNEGNATDDPDKGYSGFLLPVGMHKGFGIALFVDIITGVLSGGGFLKDVKSMYRHETEPNHTSHFISVIDPACLMDMHDYYNRIEDWKKRLKATQMKNSDDHLLLPGERAWKCEQRHLKEGIPIAENVVTEVNSLASQLNIPNRL